MNTKEFIKEMKFEKKLSEEQVKNISNQPEDKRLKLLFLTDEEFEILKNSSSDFILKPDIEREKEARKRSLKIFTDKIAQAEEFIKSYPFFYDKNGLWWFWNYEKFCYELGDEVELLNKFRDVDEDIATTKSITRQEIIWACKQVGRQHIPEDAKPSWVQFKNKIIDLDNGNEFVASPEYFITNPIEWDIGEIEETPTMDKLFISWVGEEHKEELYELLAFSIVPSYFIHRLFCLIGSGANGKSTFLKILKKFIGKENVSSSSLNLLLKERFEGSKLLKKLVCLIGETNFNLITNTDFLKKLTGEDLVRCEFKGVDSFDFTNYAKLIMATNSLPPTADKTEGFYRRWKIIDFFNKFSEEKDVFSIIPEQEYENLALKCLNIAKRLWKERVFTNDGTFEMRKQRYEEKSNPILKYIKDEYEKDINGEILYQEFFDGFVNFLEERGYRILSSIVVSKLLKIEGYEIKKQTREGKTQTYILGLKQKTNNPNNPNNLYLPFENIYI